MIIYIGKKANALLAQLDRVFGYEPKGQGFESLAARHKERQVSYEACLSLIQSEGLICNRRQAYVISEAVCNH